MKSSSLSVKRLDTIDVIRGLACIAVVLIHSLTFFPNVFYASVQSQLLATIIDQVMRFCVPVFVALSGYGLAKKYAQKNVSMFSFLQSRVLSVIPLYVVWSVWSYLIAHLVLTWKYAPPSTSLWQKLLTGTADYHLYFVPMLLQLYVLFPFILWLIKKYRLLALLVIFGIQLFATQYFYHTALFNSWKPIWLYGDQFRYILATTWVGYFALSIWLGMQKRLSNTVGWLAIGATGLAVVWCIGDSLFHIQTGTDPLLALMFTRFPQQVYAVCCILSVTYFVQRATTAFSLLAALGRSSYTMYLAHVYGLRMFFITLYGIRSGNWIVSPQQLTLVALTYLGLWYASPYILRSIRQR